MVDDTEQDFISNLFYFKSLVTFPLEAVIESNADGVKQTLNFIKQFCFEEKGGKLTPKILTFYYQYKSDGHEKSMKVEIPILSLVTIPYYEIHKAEFDMGINIISGIGKRTDAETGISSESLVAMLGSQNQKGLQRVDSSGNSIESYYGYDTNMNAKLEVASSDLPAGIIQLINLSQEGIQGEQVYDYEIKCDVQSIIFTPDKHDQEIDFRILPIHVSTETADYEKVVITVSSSTKEAVEYQFLKPIEILIGEPIGEPSKADALMLTDNGGKGSVKILADLTSIGSNGFISISTGLAKNFNIYYRIEL